MAFWPVVVDAAPDGPAADIDLAKAAYGCTDSIVVFIVESGFGIRHTLRKTLDGVKISDLDAEANACSAECGVPKKGGRSLKSLRDDAKTLFRKAWRR